MNFDVDRTDLHRTRLVAGAPAPLGAGDARLRIDGFALTSNNITYGAFGDALQYWKFFPAEDNWGRVPVWGFGEVIESRNASVEPGRRVQRVLAGAEVLDPLPPVGRPPELAPGPHDELPQRVAGPRVVGIGAELGSQLLAADTGRSLQGQQQHHFGLAGLELLARTGDLHRPQDGDVNTGGGCGARLEGWGHRGVLVVGCGSNGNRSLLCARTVAGRLIGSLGG